MTFRCSARHIVLTYSQCPIPFDTIAGLLADKIKDDDAYRLAQELHEDGNTHYHAFLRAAGKFNIRRPDHFDLEFNGTTYHPNIEAARNLQRAFDYVSKDGNYIDYNDPEPTNGNGASWDYVRDATTAEDLISRIEEVDPRSLILNLERIQYYAAWKYKPTLPEYESPYTNFDLPRELQAWADTNIQSDLDRPMSLILVGPSRMGKTVWARSLGKHMYWNGQFNLDKWTDDADYAVFDDWDWDRFYQYKQFLGAQHEIELTDKYRKKRTVRWGKPSIVLSNEIPSFSDMQWVRANCVIYELNRALF